MNVFRVYTLSALSAVSIWLMGCSDFLDVPPVNAPVVQTFYQTEEDLMMAVNAAYSSLANTSLYKWGFPLHYGVISDDENTPEASMTAKANYLFTADNADVVGMWNSLYQGIYRSNLVIVNSTGIDDSKGKDSYTGEAYFIRAFCYWHLVNLWGTVPIILEPREGTYSVVKASEAEVWARIQADLAAAIVLLPDEPLKNGRAFKASAHALMGKALLQQKKYAEAAPYLKLVIDNTKLGFDPLNKIWTVEGEYGKENVFEISYLKTGENPFYDDGATAATGGMRNVFLGPGQCGGWQNLFPSPALIAEFEADDPRLSMFIWTDGDTLPDGKIYEAEKNKSTHAIRKGMNSAISSFWPGGFEENTPVIRYADVVLLYAECLANLNDVAGAKAMINTVRARAFGDETHTVDALMTAKGWTDAEIMNAVKHERRVELCFEMHRFIDLVRWGDLAANLGTRYVATHRYLPIPQLDIDRSGGSLVQNDGY
jgi:starch-binding outer membrane protein, SusD/RagB family